MESKRLPEGPFSVFFETLFLNNPPTFLLDFQGFRTSEGLKKGYHKLIRKKMPLKTYFWLKSGQEMVILRYFFARDGALFLHFFYVFSALEPKGAQGSPKGAQKNRWFTRLYLYVFFRFGSVAEWRLR